VIRRRAVDVAMDHLDVESPDRRQALVRASLIALGAGLGGRVLTQADVALAAASGHLIDVSTYGAVGNGSDERAKIQQAINDGAALGGPFVVYLPSTTAGYGIGPENASTGLGGLKIPSGCTLTGPVGGLSKIVALASLGSSVMENADQVNGVSDVTLQFLEIDGNGANRTSSQASAVLVLMTLRGAGNGGSGLQNEVPVGLGERNRRFTVRGCYLHDSPNVALALQYMADSLVIGNEIGNNNRDSVTHFYDAEDVRIVGNYIHDGGDDMIGFNAENDVSFGHVMKRILIADNVIVGERFAGGGASMRGVNQAIVRNNVMVATLGAGVTLFNYNATSSTDVLVCDNAIFDVGRFNTTGGGIGIDIQAYGPSQQSLSGFGSVGNVVVDGNVVVNSAQQGIFVSAGIPGQRASDITLSNNRVYCSSYANGIGIALHGAGEVVDACVEGNTVVGAGQYGISLGDGTGTVTRPTIARNVVRNCGVAGIRMCTTDRPMVVSNRCFDTRTPPVQTYGLLVQLPTNGWFTEHGNDFSNNLTADVIFSLGAPTQFGRLGLGTRGVLSGQGVPENNVSADPGSLFLRSDGTAGATLYVKATGASTTGWVAK
jgi:hypothetical protein